MNNDDKLATEVLATEALDSIVTESGYLIYVTDEKGNVNGIMNNENK